VGKRALEMLARAGALDGLDSNRRKVLESLDVLVAWSTTAHTERASAQVSLFGDAASALPAPQLHQPDPWTPMEQLTHEHQAVGFYLSGHPLDEYRGVMRRLDILDHGELVRKAAASGKTSARIAGTVAALDERKSAKGNRYAFLRLSDPTGLFFEAVMFSEVLEASRDFIAPGQSVVLIVEATPEGDDLKLMVRGAQPIDHAVAGAASVGMRIFLNQESGVSALADRLEKIRSEVKTGKSGPVLLVLTALDLPGELDIRLPDCPVTPQVLSAIKSLPGIVHAEEY
jgi:DNA polymerase-3 subunit alpha